MNGAILPAQRALRPWCTRLLRSEASRSPPPGFPQSHPQSLVNFLFRAFIIKDPLPYLRAYEALVLPILVYASEAWRPYLAKDRLRLERFQRKFIARLAFPCHVDRSAISLLPLSSRLHSRDSKLANLIVRRDLPRDFSKIRGCSTCRRFRFFFQPPDPISSRPRSVGVFARPFSLTKSSCDVFIHLSLIN